MNIGLKRTVIVAGFIGGFAGLLAACGEGEPVMSAAERAAIVAEAESQVPDDPVLAETYEYS